MNVLAFARMVVAAQQNVVKYEHGATICPVCRELGLPPARCTVTCTVKEVRYLTCSQCMTCFRAIGDEKEPVVAIKPPEPALGESPKATDKPRSNKHNNGESKEKLDEKPKRNRKRTSIVQSGA